MASYRWLNYCLWHRTKHDATRRELNWNQRNYISHWLRVPEHISYKLAVLTFQSIHSTSPSYLQSCCWHDFWATAVVFYLLSSRGTARSTLWSRQTGITSCRRQRVERSFIPGHICTVTHGLQTVSQDFPLLSFLPRHPTCHYDIILGHVKHVDDDDDDDDDLLVWKINMKIVHKQNFLTFGNLLTFSLCNPS